jgi:hypothetical protein
MLKCPLVDFFEKEEPNHQELRSLSSSLQAFVLRSQRAILGNFSRSQPMTSPSVRVPDAKLGFNCSAKAPSLARRILRNGGLSLQIDYLPLSVMTSHSLHRW